MKELDNIFEDWDEDEFEETPLISIDLIEVKPLGPPRMTLDFRDFKYW